MKRLLASIIQNYIQRKTERLLFRSNEAIVEKLVSNWLTICMYNELKTGPLGESLFTLYRAIKCRINQGPVDAVTNHAKFALSIDYLLLQDVEATAMNIECLHQVNLNPVSGISQHSDTTSTMFKVDLLSCDSISQAKGKVLDTLIQHEAPNLQQISLPSLDALDLYLSRENSLLPINDRDLTSQQMAIGYKSINTLKHVGSLDSIRLLLRLKEEDSVSSIKRGEGSFSLSKSSTSRRQQQPVIVQWSHLVLPEQLIALGGVEKSPSSSVAEEKPSTAIKDKEVFMLKLLSSKQPIQPFIDRLFELMMRTSNENASSPGLPNSTSTDGVYSGSLCVRYLFGLFDQLADQFQMTDEKALQLWKSNSLMLRFWVNLLKNPDFLFIVDKSVTVDASLSTVASVLIEFSTSDETKAISENAPLNKLLFFKDIKEKYIPMWSSYISKVCSISDEVMTTAMQEIIESNRLSEHYPEVSKQLYNYAKPHAKKLQARFEAEGNRKMMEDIAQCFPKA